MKNAKQETAQRGSECDGGAVLEPAARGLDAGATMHCAMRQRELLRVARELGDALEQLGEDPERMLALVEERAALLVTVRELAVRLEGEGAKGGGPRELLEVLGEIDDLLDAVIAEDSARRERMSAACETLAIELRRSRLGAVAARAYQPRGSGGSGGGGGSGLGNIGGTSGESETGGMVDIGVDAGREGRG